MLVNKAIGIGVTQEPDHNFSLPVGIMAEQVHYHHAHRLYMKGSQQYKGTWHARCFEQLMQGTRRLLPGKRTRGGIAPAVTRIVIRANAHEQLDEATFNAAWADGYAMTMEQAVELALRVEAWAVTKRRSSNG